MRLIRPSIFALSLFSLAVSCSKKDSDKKDTTAESTVEGSSIVISGKLAVQGETLSLTGQSLTAGTVSPADLDIFCVTFSNPPVSGLGDISATGEFSLSLAANKVAVGCFILKGDESLGTIIFKDPSEKSLVGEEKTADRLAFGGSTNLGNIVFDLSTGKAEVDVSKIVAAVKPVSTVSATAYDFTGSYEATSLGIDLPKGYTALCPAGTKLGDDGCHGPREGEKLFFKRLTGKNPVNGNAKYAAMIWDSEASFKSCGSKLGIKYADAKLNGIDLTDSGVEDGPLVWAAGLIDGWKDETNAKTNRPLMKVVTADFNNFKGTKQFFTKYRQCTGGQPCDPMQAPVVNAPGFSFFVDNEKTGCRDAAGKPYQPKENEWMDQTCTHEDLGGGLSRNTCKKGDLFTCVNIGGTFDANGAPLANAIAKFPDDYEVYAAADASCASIATVNDSADKRLAQLRCYADYYYQNDGNDGGESDVCRRDVRTNWGATTPEQFVLGKEGPVRARNEHVFDLFDYSSETSGSIRGENTNFRGIEVNNNHIDCEIREVFSISIKRDGTTNNLLAEMVQSETNVSPKPVCIAEYGAARTVKALFKLVKK